MKDKVRAKLIKDFEERVLTTKDYFIQDLNTIPLYVDELFKLHLKDLQIEYLEAPKKGKWFETIT